jgi:hypothetical protein
MRQLKEKELALIDECISGIISVEEFYNRFPFKVSMQEIVSYLDSFIINKKFQRFEIVLWNIPKEFAKTEEGRLFGRYLLVDGHFSHDNIASAFQTYFNDNKSFINPLIEAVSNVPEYLQNDDVKYPYLRKIIYAIGAQPEPYNINALEVLLSSDDLQIVDLVKHQIEKRKSRGRWETENI